MASGRPDWFGTIVAAGKYDTTFIPIGLDETGAILALMKGAYDSALKTIAVDSSGIMKANLSVQDLDFLTVRPAYGKTRREADVKTAVKNTITNMYTVTGKGTVLSGWMRCTSAATNKDLIYDIYVDGILLIEIKPINLHTYSLYHAENNVLYLLCYDDVNFEHIIGIQPGITFETSFHLHINNPYGVDHSINYRLHYAIVPD